MALDYKKFLQSSTPTSVVLPYFGGLRVDAKDRWYHVEEEGLAVGWHRFALDHRRARALEPAAPIELSTLPAVRGHVVDGWIVADGKTRARIAIAPDDEPAPLSRATARTWHSGEHLFDSVDFEDDAELRAREALQERRALGDAKGVVPSLRAAFGFALGLAVARELDIPMTVPELEPIVVDIADGGGEVVRTLFAEMIAEREAQREAARVRAEAIARAKQQHAAVANAKPKVRHAAPHKRADEILRDAEARLVEYRMLDRGARMDVTYVVDGVRVISTIDSETFQILDPGVCLAEAHRVLTLDAMPSVIREAVVAHHLNITRRS